MKKLVLIVILFCISWVIYSQDYEINEEKINNGPNVVFINGNCKDYVNVCIYVRIGENPPGLAHLGEHLVFGTNKEMIGGDLDFVFESLGSTCDAYTNYDYSAYKWTINKKYLSKSLEIMSYALLYPTPNENELILEKKIIKDEFSRKSSINFDSIRMMLQKELYGDSYYGNPIEGESIEDISLEELKDFYANNYISKNMSIFIYGDIDQVELIQTISKYYSQNDKNSFDIPIEVKINSKNLKIKGTKNYYGIMFPMAPSYKLKDSITSDVLSQLFDILSSRIINEKYNYKSVYIHNTGRYASPFSLIYECEDINFVKGAILLTLDNILKGNFTENDVENAQNSIISDYLGKNTNIDEISYNTGFNYNIYNFETSYLYDKYIKQIKKEDIVKVANKYLNKWTSLVCEKEK